MKLKNEALEKLYGTIVNCVITISPFANSPVDEAFAECDRELTNLQNRNDILEKSNGTLLDANLDLCAKNRDLKKELNASKFSVEYFKESRDYWRNRAKHEEEEKNEQVKRADSLAEQVEQLKKDRDIWVRNNGEKQAEIAELKKQLDELTSQYQKLTIENKRLQDSVREIGYEQGQTDLWDALQNVNDTQPNEFDVECESMHDVIGMDLEDFLDIYKKWQEQKEIDRMRDYLERFCLGRLCYYCPLHTDGFNCSRGKWMAGIPDKDIKRYYEKACGCGLYTLKNVKLISATMERVNRGITKACASFCEAVRDADIKITENVCRNSWECTLKATVDVNKDLLNKVCGIVPVEEEHKLEYGDAVRLPWRDYDYMYIGPYEESKTLVRMFDPEMHAMVTSHIGNVKYNGGKIVICDEEDLRKIWKDKK